MKLTCTQENLNHGLNIVSLSERIAVLRVNLMLAWRNLVVACLYGNAEFLHALYGLIPEVIGAVVGNQVKVCAFVQRFGIIG